MHGCWSNHYRDIVIFRFSSWRPSTMLDFKKFGILIAGRMKMVKMRHLAKFCSDRSNRSEIWRFINFSIFWLSVILDLLCACLDNLRRAFSGPYHFAKFNWNRCSSFNSMHVLRFCGFYLKMFICVSKIGVLGSPQNADK